jgi:hypothetical protein
VKPIRALALSLCACLALPVFSADEWATRMANDLRTPCFDQLAPLAAKDVVWRDLHSFAEGVGIANKLGPNWKAGNRHYDAAYRVMRGAATDFEKSNGPMATVDVRAAYARAFSQVPSNERKPLNDFLATRAGKFTAEHFFDDVLCFGIVRSMERRQIGFEDASDAAAFASLKKRRDSRGAEFERGKLLFLPSDQVAIDRHGGQFTQLFQSTPPGAAPSNRLGIDGLVVVQKLGRDIGGTLPSVLEIVREFQKTSPAGS